jgi:diguanylate cyclase (GGDEF)-like protein
MDARSVRAAVSGQLEAGERLHELAYRDPLTGHGSRTLLIEQLERALESGQDAAVLVVAVDDFHELSYSLGYVVGDELLRLVALRLFEAKRSSDSLTRAEGADFQVLVTGDRDGIEWVAEEVAETVLASLQVPVILRGTEFQLTASVGLESSSRGATSASDLLGHASAGAVSARRAGGNTLRWYAPPPTDPVERLSTAARLRQALARDELEVHYQPIHTLSPRAVYALEALVRWRRPGGELVLPGDFIPIAEQTGLIEGVGDSVLTAICRQATAWKEAGLGATITFNVSPRQLRRTDLVSIIGDLAVQREFTGSPRAILHSVRRGG